MQVKVYGIAIHHPSNKLREKMFNGEVCEVNIDNTWKESWCYVKYNESLYVVHRKQVELLKPITNDITITEQDLDRALRSVSGAKWDCNLESAFDDVKKELFKELK